MEEKEDTFTT